MATKMEKEMLGLVKDLIADADEKSCGAATKIIDRLIGQASAARPRKGKGNPPTEPTAT